MSSHGYPEDKWNNCNYNPQSSKNIRSIFGTLNQIRHESNAHDNIENLKHFNNIRAALCRGNGMNKHTPSHYSQRQDVTMGSPINSKPYSPNYYQQLNEAENHVDNQLLRYRMQTSSDGRWIQQKPVCPQIRQSHAG